MIGEFTIRCTRVYAILIGFVVAASEILSRNRVTGFENFQSKVLHGTRTIIGKRRDIVSRANFISIRTFATRIASCLQCRVSHDT